MPKNQAYNKKIIIVIQNSISIKYIYSTTDNFAHLYKIIIKLRPKYNVFSVTGKHKVA